MTRSYQIEMFRVCSESKDKIARVIAIHSFKERERAINELDVKSRMKELSGLDLAELSTLFLAVMTWYSYQDILTKHFGLDKERKFRDKIKELKEKDGSSVTFGGHSIFGALLDQACERYKWSADYVVWGISLVRLNMMLSDSVQSVYLSEEERKKLHYTKGGQVIKADDPRNAALVKAFFDNINKR
jgi:hypothetical protein